MAYNGAGVYSLYTPGNPVVSGTTIDVSWGNNTLNDIATALSTVICKDGQTTTTASVPFAQGLGVGAANAFAVNASGTLTSTSTSTQVVKGPFDISAATAGQIIFPATQNASAGGNTLDDYEENTFAPTVTLVGGVGNTVPVYTTNTGRHTKIGNRAFVDVLLTGDGGAEGAGTGQINVALPFTSSASEAPTNFTCGVADNGGTTYLLSGFIGAGAGTIALSYWSTISALSSFTGADQNNTTRTITLRFEYETAT